MPMPVVTPQMTPLIERYEEKQGCVERPSGKDIHFMEHPVTHDKLQWEHDDQGENIEWRHVREDCIRFHTLERQDGPAELNLCGGICRNQAERIGQHRDQNGQEECIAQE